MRLVSLYGRFRSVELLREGARSWGMELGSAQLKAFDLYREWLLTWNRRLNLTRITEPAEVEVLHFLDSLSCLLVLDPLPAGTRLIDVGAGAGFPGIPLKIMVPGLELALLEATAKRSRFLEAVAEALGLSPVEVIQARAEEAGQHPDYRERYDVGVARAVGPLPVLLEYVLPLVLVGGAFIAQRGTEAEAEVASSGMALERLGGEVADIRPVRLPGAYKIRHLVRVEKVTPTPARYPRRPGIPRKRPL
ncbi:MAG: 16S rRNA (guanine(527)-N(7))-methyltransferase RsmG [Anaerolineae bacterium]